MAAIAGAEEASELGIGVSSEKRRGEAKGYRVLSSSSRYRVSGWPRSRDCGFHGMRAAQGPDTRPTGTRVALTGRVSSPAKGPRIWPIQLGNFFWAEARATGLVGGGGRRRRRCVRERRAGWPLCTPSVGIATSPPSRLVAGCFSYRCLFRPPVACDGECFPSSGCNLQIISEHSVARMA